MSMYRGSCPFPGSPTDGPTGSTKTNSPGHTTSPQPGYPQVCEDGQPYVTDPLTGRQVCLCGLGLERTLTARLPMVSGTMKAFSHLPTATLSSPGLEYDPFDPSAIYSPLIRGFSIRPDRPSPFLAPGAIGHQFPFESNIASHPYGFIYPGVEMGHGALRKAATRETTGPLKEWLREHKKNPYPTKAEKIMMAIITKMSLTQVSTWFANARRRLKKEHRLFNPEGKGQGRENNPDEDDVMSDEHCNDEEDDYKSVDDKTVRPKHEMVSTQDPASSTFSETDNEDINVDSSESESEARNSFLDETRFQRVGDEPSGDRLHTIHPNLQNNIIPPHHPSVVLSSHAVPSSLSTGYHYTNRLLSPLASSSYTPVRSTHEWALAKAKLRRLGVVRPCVESSSAATVSKTTNAEGTSQTKTTNSRTVKKPKIWSISEIIDEGPSTQSTRQEHRSQSGDRDDFGYNVTVPFLASQSPGHSNRRVSSSFSSPLTLSHSPPPSGNLIIPSPGSKHSSFTRLAPSSPRATHEHPTSFVSNIGPSVSLPSSPDDERETFFRLNGNSSSSSSSFVHKPQLEYSKMPSHDSRFSVPHNSTPTDIVLRSNGLRFLQRKTNFPHTHYSQDHLNLSNFTQSPLSFTNQSADLSDSDNETAPHLVSFDQYKHERISSDTDARVKKCSVLKIKSKHPPVTDDRVSSNQLSKTSDTCSRETLLYNSERCQSKRGPLTSQSSQNDPDSDKMRLIPKEKRSLRKSDIEQTSPSYSPRRSTSPILKTPLCHDGRSAHGISKTHDRTENSSDVMPDRRMDNRSRSDDNESEDSEVT